MVFFFGQLSLKSAWISFVIGFLDLESEPAAVTRLCLLWLKFFIVLAILQKTASFPTCCNVRALFWLTHPTGADPNNNYNRTARHSFSQAWILPSDLSSLLSQEQSPSVITCYGEWWLICFYAAILKTFFPLSWLKGPLCVTVWGVVCIWLATADPNSCMQPNLYFSQL